MQKLLGLLVVLLSFQAWGSELNTPLDGFKALYTERLPTVSECGSGSSYQLCADTLRDDGNGPFVLHHGKATEQVVVLFHGLSDSPYYMRPIAEYIHSMGVNVVVALLPGHGLIDAHDVILDFKLSEKWVEHVNEVMALAPQFGENVIVGGFSTGGALATQFVLSQPDKVTGLMLFSGALALSGNAESLSKIWGVQWLARLLDGQYTSQGPNPYKYPSVPNTAGLELMEIITDVRQRIEQGASIAVPMLVVHSESDLTTPMAGVEQLLTSTQGQNTVFYINKSYQLCHADLVLNTRYAAAINIDPTLVNPLEACAVPKANPLFRQMTNMIRLYMAGVQQ